MMMQRCDSHSDGRSAIGKSERVTVRPATMRSDTALPAALPAALSITASCRTASLRIGGSLLILLLALMPAGVRANCTFKQGTSPSPVDFTMSSSITIPFNLAVGAVLGNPVLASPSYPATVHCSNNMPYGMQNLVGSNTTSGGTNYIYPTSVSGLGYQLIHADNPSSFMSPYPDNLSGPKFTAQFSVGTTLQLVQTGPIANGSILQAGTLANWQWGSIDPEYFVLQNSITFVAPACVVNTTNIAVTLPTVTTAAFSGKDSTTGATPSSIQLTCPSGATSQLSIMFAAQNGTPPGYNNVLKNTGSATGLGVEMIYNSSSVIFGSAIFVGTTPAGGLSIPFTAQYHSVSNTVTAGGVQAAATFTLSYQ